MSDLAPLTESEVQKFAADWYRKLDVHAPLEEYKPLLADDELEMKFPEATVTGFAGFSDWYNRVIGIFFDEVHNVKEATITSTSGETSTVKVVVKWEASVWKPPAPNSERIILDAYQTWIVKRSPETNQPMIVTYIVDSLEYAEGSAQL